jgi:hypothetical protein
MVAARQRARVELQGDPEIRIGLREREAGRHDADDRGGHPVEEDASPHDLRVAGEGALPQAVADDERADVPGQILVRAEGAAHEGLDADRAREGVCRVRRRRAEGPVARGEGRARDLVAGDRLVAAAVAQEIEVLRRRDPEPVELHRGELGVELHELPGVGEGEGPQDHRVHHAEDGGHRADPQPEGQDGDGGEGGILEYQAGGEAKVAKDFGHGRWCAGPAAGYSKVSADRFPGRAGRPRLPGASGAACAGAAGEAVASRPRPA